MNPTTEKNRLRARFKAYRQSLTPDEYARRSSAIAGQVGALPEVRQARTVHCYWPMVSRREVDLRSMIEVLYRGGTRMVLPVVTAYTRKRSSTPRLTHVDFTGRATLRTNPWGLHEPSTGPCVPVEELDVVIVPALGAGRNGYRVGHGFGYYDEFLAPLHVPTVCPVFAACLVETVPAEPHDVPVTLICTETATLRPTHPA